MTKELSSAEKRALLVKMLAQRNRAAANSYELSHGQQSLWFLQQLFPDSGAYNESFAWKIKGKPDLSKLKSISQRLCQHHAVLRTTYEVRDGKPVAIVHPQMGIEIQTIDAASLDENQLQRAMHTEASRPIDIRQGPIFRITIFQCPSQQIWLTTVHHIAIDLWSMTIIMEDLRNLMIESLLGQTIELQSAPTYQQYAQWHADFLKSDRAAAQRNYWVERITGVPLLDFPMDYPRPSLQTFRGGAQTFWIDRAMTSALEQLCRQNKTTLYTVLLSVFEALLVKYSGQDRFLVGSVLSGRTQSQFRRTVGLLANPVALQVDSTNDPTFIELLERTKQAVIGAIDNQDYPFSLLVEQLAVERDLSRPPLVNVAFILQNQQGVKRELQSQDDLQLFGAGSNSSGGIRQNLSGLLIELYVMDQENAKFDLRLEMFEAGGQITGILRYNVDLIHSSTARRLADSFQFLCRSVIANPNQKVSKLSVMDADEIRAITEFHTSGELSWPQPDLIPLRIRAVAMAQPQSTAIEFDRRSWTYAQLIQAADCISEQILALNPKQGEILSIYLPRTPTAIASILAGWQTGMATMPVDISYPQARLVGMMQDARPSIVLTDPTHLDGLREMILLAGDQLRQAQIVVVDSSTFDSQISTQPQPGTLKNKVTSSDGAYVVFTSGSTGRAKGVVLPHAALSNLYFAQQQQLNIQPSDRLLQFANLCFDASMAEIVQALASGATLVLPEQPSALVGDLLWQQLAQSKISLVTLPPSILATLPLRPLANLKCMLVAGEQCPANLISQWSLGRRMFNAYGPSEAGVCATMHKIELGQSAAIIGRPLTNVRVYLLDQHRQPVPVGATGKIFVGGPGVGLGYLAQTELTAQSFVNDPFRPGQRMYKTGDLGRYLSDGQIEFKGRTDQQVKLRGYRIELDEIQTVLLSSGLLTQAVVLTGQELSSQLVAFVVPKASQTVIAGNLESNQSKLCLEGLLLAHCKKHLPGYMVPNRFIQLETMPTSLNGKVEREQLIQLWKSAVAQASELMPSQPYVAPRTALERDLCDLFEQVLGRSNVGVMDNFFELGGHSLLAVQLTSRINLLSNQSIPLHLVFANPTVAGIAQIINSSEDSTANDTQLQQQLRADAKLDASIVFSQPILSNPPQQILLTGATGFLGTHLLVDLLQQTTAQVHCLVRAESVEQARQRVLDRLSAFGLADDCQLSRVVFELGDLAAPLMGLSWARFHELADQLDSIYHNGATVNFALPYSRLKSANVCGTLAAIELSSLGKAKSLHYVSTLSVFPLLNPLGPATFQESDRFDNPHWLWDGYAQSKWVAEQLIFEAGDRGLPVTVFRPGRITGHSHKGHSEQGDLLLTVIERCVRLGMVPNWDATLDMTPVDYVSRAIVTLSLDPTAWGGCFHLNNPSPILLSQLMNWLRSQGHSLRTTSLHDWKLASQAGDSTDLLNNLLALVPNNILPPGDQPFDLPIVRHSCQATERLLQSKQVICPTIDEKLLSLYFGYLACP